MSSIELPPNKKRPDWFVTARPVTSAMYIADDDYHTRKRKGTGPMLGKKYRCMLQELKDANTD